MEIYRELNRLIIENGANDWAREMASINPSNKAKRIEACRFELLQLIKKVEPIDGMETEDAYNLLLLLITVDRANALKNMKIDRNDPNCPPGFLWCTEEDLKKYNLEDVVKVNGVAARSSITSKYLKFAALYGLENDGAIAALLKARMPVWILNRFGNEMIKKMIIVDFS